MIIDISVAVIALAFVILVIYLIVMTKALRVTLSQVNQTLAEARKQLGEIGSQTAQISVDLKQKVEALNPIFNAFNQAGQILESQATALKKDFLDSVEDESHSGFFSDEHKEKKKEAPTYGLATAAAVLELAGIGMSLWQKLKKRR